jgi:fructuronate reductase
MIDRIVPSPSEKVAQQLVKSGFGDTKIFVTKKHTVTAPFVNTEEVNYLVIEDHFPNGRPPLEKAGVYFTNRETVDKAERMKVYTCLNPIHTTMAVFGCMLGYNSIADETNDPEIKKLIKKVGFDEGLPVVSDPGIINPVTFLNEFLYKRLPNKNIPDTPQRITTDTSQKIRSIYGQTIQLYKEKAGKLQFIPLSIAGWLRYLMGMDDQGNSITLSPDPMMNYLQNHIKAIRFGDPQSVADHLYPVLSNKQIFGVDLDQVHLGRKIEKFVKEMITHKGAVRATLKKYLYDEKEES